MVGEEKGGEGGVKIWTILHIFQVIVSSFACVTFTFYSYDLDILIGICINQGLYTT